MIEGAVQSSLIPMGLDGLSDLFLEHGSLSKVLVEGEGSGFVFDGRFGFGADLVAIGSGHFFVEESDFVLFEKVSDVNVEFEGQSDGGIGGAGGKDGNVLKFFDVGVGLVSHESLGDTEKVASVGVDLVGGDLASGTASNQAIVPVIERGQRKRHKNGREEGSYHKGGSTDQVTVTAFARVFGEAGHGAVVVSRGEEN
jgi:hypothetical protein